MSKSRVAGRLGRLGMLSSWVLSLGAVSACGGDDGGDDARAQVVEQYVAMVRANYDDTVAAAEALDRAIAAFVDKPSQATLDAARDAWLAAREPYDQTEAYRFYEGPIDHPETGVEGRINAWPLDEAFIDSVEGAPEAGIINDVEGFPALTKDVLAAQNERGGEDNIATGYHAIEFLLWGQDRDDDGPGARPYTDFVTGDENTRPNPERRAQYLTLASELLLDDLKLVRAAWGDGDDTYASTFAEADANDSLKKILRGISELAGNELSGERIIAGYESHEQEDEHSCFSDNTHRDVYLDALGIENVYFGRYGELDGPGLDELVRAADAALDDEIQTKLEAVMSAVDAMPVPFDQALRSETKREKLKAVADALFDLNGSLVKISAALELGR